MVGVGQGQHWLHRVVSRWQIRIFRYWFRCADPAVYRVRIADHKLERVADLKNLRRVVTAWLSWCGLTPDGSPLLMRDVGTQEINALDFEAP